MASNIASAAMWAAVFTPTADEIAKEIVAEEARLRALEEKAYWEGWDKTVKEGVIERLRDPNDELRFSPVTYPDITKEMWADLIENGEIKLYAPIKEATGFLYLWVDDTRIEAQRKGYRDSLPKVMEVINGGGYRAIN